MCDIRTFKWICRDPIKSNVRNTLETAVPVIRTFYFSVEKKRLLEICPSGWAMIGVIVLFGAIHFIPWPFIFPTATERWL